MNHCVEGIVGQDEDLKGLMKTFWAYFDQVWVGTYGIRAFNLHRLVAEQNTIANRTNNPLERSDDFNGIKAIPNPLTSLINIGPHYPQIQPRDEQDFQDAWQHL